MPMIESGVALSGIRVIDFTHAAAGPICSMVLSDFGAEVLKVEKPGRGDHARHMTMMGIRDYVVGGEYYLGLNRNKRSLAIDVSTPRGRDLILDLVERSDVVLENFRPGVMEKLGLGYDELRTRNEGIIYCKVSGFGTRGPLGRDAGMDIVAQARAGTIALTGERGGPPIKPGPPIADLGAGLQATIGILVALRARELTGKGQKVEVSLVDAALLMLSHIAASVLNSDVQIPPMGRGHPQLVPYQGFKASDGWFFVGCGTNRLWRALCDVLDRPDLAADERFTTNPSRVENRAALEAMLAPIFGELPVDEWVNRLRARAIPCAPILSPREGYDFQEAAGFPIVQTVEHPDLGTIRLPGVSIQLSDTPGGARTYPPRLGEQTEPILSELLGMNAGEIARLNADGVIACYDDAEHDHRDHRLRQPVAPGAPAHPRVGLETEGV